MSLVTEFETEAHGAEAASEQSIEGRSQWQLTWRRLRRPRWCRYS